MPFSKAWRSAMFPDYRDQGAYVDYKATKDILHRMKEDIANPSTPDELYQALLQQKKGVYEWCVRKKEEMQKVTERLYRSSKNLSDEDFSLSFSLPLNTLSSGSVANRPLEVRFMADAITHELLRFVECRNLNTDTIEHIIGRMYRYAVLGPTGEHWKSIYRKYDFYDISIDEIFCLLSRIYDRVTLTEERISAKGKTAMTSGTVGSQVFDRRSVKYWVHMQDLPFIIARIIPHLPLSTFTDTYAESKTKGLSFQLGSPVSSIYYDNSKFLFYHRRLERLEGSSLIRIRWYSDTYASDWNAISPNGNVFMEMKVHHEAWSGERSNKRRFALKEKEVDDFIHGHLSLVPALEKLKAKNASEDAQEQFRSLATEILTKLHAYSLKPVLRTQCRRVAFQRGSDQSVRVSIDTDLRMSSEDFGLGHHWRYDGSDVPVSHFPYAVVEVKLQCTENERIAPWIEELMGCRHMESIPKFSKYAHGIASLYGHTSHIQVVPYWMPQLGIDIRASTKPEQKHWDPTVGLAAGCVERTADRLIFGSREAQTQTVGASEAKFLHRSDYARVYQQMLTDTIAGEGEKESSTGGQTFPVTTSMRGTETRGGGSFKEDPVKADAPAAASDGTLLRAPVVQYSVDRRHSAYTTFHLYPYTEAGVESLCFMPGVDRNGTAKVLYGNIPWQTGKRIKVPQKYDPKTLLTSERYMVKWAQFATQFGLLGLASIRFGRGLFLPNDVAQLSPLWRGQFHIIIGLALVTISLFTLVYAYFSFKARARRVYARRKIRYDNTWGSTYLTMALMFAFGALVTAHVVARYGPMLLTSDAF